MERGQAGDTWTQRCSCGGGGGDGVLMVVVMVAGRNEEGGKWLAGIVVEEDGEMERRRGEAEAPCVRTVKWG